MQTLIFEADHSGHRLHYVSLIAEALLPLGHEVTIALSREASSSQEFDVHLGSSRAMIHRLRSHEGSSDHPWEVAGHKLRTLSEVLKTHEPDHVYIPYGDGMTQRGALAWRRPGRRLTKPAQIEALHLRGHFAYVTKSLGTRAKRRFARELILRSPWDRLHLLDPLAYEYLVRHTRGLGRKTQFDLVPEPVEPGLNRPSIEARDRLGLDAGARYIGGVGVIDERKGIDRLLAAFASGLGANVKLLLVGKHDPKIRAALASDYRSLVQAGSIVSMDSYVSQQDLQDALVSCDVIALPYRQHAGSSAIAVRAAAARRPIVASDYGWLGECVRRFELGLTCKAEDPRQLADAITSVLRESSPLKLTHRAQRFVEFNSIDNFQHVWTRQIQLREQHAAPPNAKTWEWVMSGDPDSADL